jgi:cytochrome c oxidase subunit II
MYTADPQNASNFVAGYDRAFILTMGVSLFFLIGLTIVMLVFIFKYKKEKHPKAIQNEGSNLLEILWTVIPLALVLIMFYFGWMGWRPMKRPPKEGLHVKAIARMWNFNFQYENGKFADSLIVPLNEPVILDLVAIDVLHGMYIPAFRVKEDMVPNQKKVMWFIPGTEGSFDLFCSEYCGLQHSYMFTGVKVLPKEEFDAWLNDTTTAVAVAETEASPDQQGLAVLKKYACTSCHSLDGSKLVGPTYKGVWGETQTVVTNRQKREVTVDAAYIRKSILDPDADVVEGYNPGLMRPYDNITDQEIDQIIEYLKTLND